ncbi:hypothetical protein [Noviherbaspirillum sedimenti]|uniref:Uncharacterized protein n=1 Tax=Noviherbaspirillum sedimenti TaxID=2320865 RepID=A0A3A3G4T0_9BURK|nr:hypothetical protein [Noviherbaspirillum sedimenti]RJG03498.1 hypothetical protein D3878_19430 [Noviherbaspirillum sedimenti]
MSESTLATPASGTGKRVVQMSERLNSKCFCISLDNDALRQALESELGSSDLVAQVEKRCPYLFAAQPVFISDSQTKRLAEVVRAVESAVALPAYREHILAHAPAIARHDPGGAKGVFFGYDFHLREGGIGLIEINTNAGGAMLNAVMARAHQVCCMDKKQLASAAASAAALEKNIVDMFLAEWRLSSRDRPLQTIAIVDTAPQQQYLYPEFLLFQKLFERHGLHAVIADPSELKLHEGVLWYGDMAIDLAYNRLTDFMLESPESAALRAAYLEQAVVLTPHPQAHALYADKRNLALLCDAGQLQALGVPQDVQDVLLASILPTEVVDAVHADRLWNERRHLFFKPAAGYGSRAAYRGDKLTRRVWQDILAGEYVAQALMSPGERVIGPRESPESLKFDIRCYTYGGNVQWTAARMYQGQTTNFRTPGGGFAPVYSLPDVDFTCEIDAISKAAGSAMTCCGSDCT